MSSVLAGLVATTCTSSVAAMPTWRWTSSVGQNPSHMRFRPSTSVPVKWSWLIVSLPSFVVGAQALPSTVRTTPGLSAVGVVSTEL